jgi:membrane-bound ClpP family serine protease
MSVGSYGVNSPQAWIVACAAIAGGVLLFRPRSGSAVMVLGIVVGAWALLFALTALGNQSSPSWGVGLTLVGGALLAYSGHLTNQYERGG